jgi:hypothetical protein
VGGRDAEQLETSALFRYIKYEDAANNLRVAERSLDNLFAALRETDRPERKVLTVLAPMREEIDGNETDLTKHVRAILEGSGRDFLDLHQPISAYPHRDDFFYANQSHLEIASHRFVGDRISEKLESFFRSGLERRLRRDGVVKAANDLYSVRRIFPGASIVRSCVVSSTSKFTRFFPDLSATAAGYSNRSCKIYLRSIGLGYPILYFLLLLRAEAESETCRPAQHANNFRVAFAKREKLVRGLFIYISTR